MLFILIDGNTINIYCWIWITITAPHIANGYKTRSGGNVKSTGAQDLVKVIFKQQYPDYCRL